MRTFLYSVTLFFVLQLNSLLVIGNEINLVKFGADNTGKIDVSLVFQNALKLLSGMKGGGTLQLPEGVYLLKYPVFVPSNIKIIGKGEKTIIKANISISEGRCAFVVGNSYEWNSDVINNFRLKGKRGWPRNTVFKDILMGQGLNLRSADNRIRTRKSSIENIMIIFDYKGCKSNWGGYGIQFSNAADCSAKNIWTMYACQAIGIGSDTPPSSPACVNIHCSNIYVVRPDSIRTYFAIGMIANSNNCSITNSKSLYQCTENSKDGSIVSMNFTKNCSIRNIQANVGRTETSEGVFLNNSYGAIVENITINNAKKGIAISFTDYDSLLKNSLLKNKIDYVMVKNSDVALLILSKFNIFNNFISQNCKLDIEFNTNATNNIFYVQKTDFLSGYFKNKDWFEKNNEIN